MYSFFKSLVVFLTKSFIEFVESRFFQALFRFLMTYWLLTQLDGLDAEILETILRILTILQAL